MANSSIQARNAAGTFEAVDRVPNLMMKLTGDSLTLFLLCSHLGLSDEPAAKPLTAREWNDL